MSKVKVMKELKKALKDLEKAKKIYKKVDELTEQALELNIKGDKELILVDNFEDKNSIWKPAKVVRFNYKLKKVA